MSFMRDLTLYSLVSHILTRMLNFLLYMVIMKNLERFIVTLSTCLLVSTEQEGNIMDAVEPLGCYVKHRPSL